MHGNEMQSHSDACSPVGLHSKCPANMKFLLCGLVYTLTLIQGELTVNAQNIHLRYT